MSGSRSLNRLVVTALTTLLVMGLLSFADADDAHAGVLIGLDANGGFNINDLNKDGLGFGANARLGYQLDIPILRLAPELQFNYMGFAIANPDASDAVGAAASSNVKTFSGRGGVRVGFSAIVGAALYAHAGYGVANTTTDEGEEATLQGVSMDAGLAFDFTMIPFINLGLHAGVNMLKDTDAADGVKPLRWLDTGLHVEVVF